MVSGVVPRWIIAGVVLIAAIVWLMFIRSGLLSGRPNIPQEPVRYFVEERME